MAKLVFYSDQGIPENEKVDKALMKLIGKDNPKIGFIPSASDYDRKYYNEKVKYYKKYGVESLLYFELDDEFDSSKVDELLKCDAIHLTGGNTFYFLNSLRKRDFLKVLQEYVRNGGVLIGASAGAMLMTKDISVAGMGTCKDENKGIKDYSALGLVDFEFCPHINSDRRDIEDVIEHSKTNGRPIYACKDGDGIVVDGDKIEFFGDILKIENGKVGF